MKTVEILLSEDEAQMLADSLAALAGGVAEAGDENAARKLRDLGTRVAHATITGEGVPPETRKAMVDEIAIAVQSGSLRRQEAAFERFLTIVGRLDPDPPKALAECITRALNGIQRAGQISGAVGIIDLIRAKLNSMQAEFEGADGVELVEYLSEWTKAGKTAVLNGEDPWCDDPDVQKAPDEA